MDVEATLVLLRKHEVTSATFDGAGALLSVRFATTGAPPTTEDDESDDTGEPSPFRTAMHNAAGVLQGRHKSMREDANV